MKLELIGGKTVTLEGFNMEPTYADMLAGIPTEESNQLLIKSIKPPKKMGSKSYIIKNQIYMLLKMY